MKWKAFFACFSVRGNSLWRKVGNAHCGPSLGALTYSRETPINYFWYMFELPDTQSIKRA